MKKVRKRLKPKHQQILSWIKIFLNNGIIIAILIVAAVTGDNGTLALETIGALIAENLALIAFLKYISKGSSYERTDEEIKAGVPVDGIFSVFKKTKKEVQNGKV